MTRQRVVIVGAGMAGLTATPRLNLDRHDVASIEAGSRLGGRARTVRAPFRDGQYVESGAEWIDTHHHRMRRLLDRYGMALQGEGQQWTTIRRWLHRDGRLQSPADLGDEVYKQIGRVRGDRPQCCGVRRRSGEPPVLLRGPGARHHLAGRRCGSSRPG